MSKKVNLLSLSAIVLLSACSSSEPTQETVVGDIPSWVLNPQVEDGIAVSECVLWSGNMSLDKHQAIANARASLAQRIQTHINTMDKAYRDKIEAVSGSQSGSTFSSVSKQVTQQTLVGTNPLKVDIVNIEERKNLCVLVGIGQESTKVLFDDLVKAAERPMNDDQKGILYQEFKAQRADLSLDKGLDKLNAE